MTDARQKETLVVGSGASGLTIALLMAKAGRKVRLVDSQPEIGGYLNRFSRRGRRFETGFHFTGSFESVLGEMLDVLGMKEDVREQPLSVDVMLAESKRTISFPNKGVAGKIELLSRLFPNRADAIAKYYRVQEEIVKTTPMFSLYDRNLDDTAPSLYEAVTLSEFFDSLDIQEPELRTLLGLMTVCHGTPPSEVPLAYHCRAGFGLDERVRAVAHGGDAFLCGFRRELERAGVSISTSCRAVSLEFSSDSSECVAVKLSDGETIEVDDVFFAIHPSEFLPLLPETARFRSIRRRVSRFSETCGFFSVCALVDTDAPPACAKLAHYISENNLDKVLAGGGEAYGTGIMVKPSRLKGEPCKVVAFRTMHTQDVPFVRGSRAYLDFKKRTEESILEDVYCMLPSLKGGLQVVDVATPLTFARYAPPSGSAYGVRRKIAESRISGRLPARNLHAIGHNALMPGVVGVMTGAFLEFRHTVGEGLYFEIIGDRAAE